MPWDTLVSICQNQLNNSQTEADGINLHVAIGAIIIKHICDLNDRKTVFSIEKNMYMEYFIIYSSFSNEEPFALFLFVDFRKRLEKDQFTLINEKILGLSYPREDL